MYVNLIYYNCFVLIFTGTTALIQISTKSCDYIICPFVNWNEVNANLNCVLRNPKISKIFHAIDNDFLSLRRDFQTTLVGAVDTKEAYKLLTMTSEAISFESLLEKFNLNQSKLRFLYHDKLICQTTRNAMN